jgi:hypothetical protein
MRSGCVQGSGDWGLDVGAQPSIVDALLVYAGEEEVCTPAKRRRLHQGAPTGMVSGRLGMAGMQASVHACVMLVYHWVVENTLPMCVPCR